MLQHRHTRQVTRFSQHCRCKKQMRAKHRLGTSQNTAELTCSNLDGHFLWSDAAQQKATNCILKQWDGQTQHQNLSLTVGKTAAIQGLSSCEFLSCSFCWWKRECSFYSTQFVLKDPNQARKKISAPQRG